MPEKTGGRRAPTGVPFVKGDPRCGRPKGSRGKITLEIINFARRFCGSAEYRESVTRRILAGEAPRIEELFLYYAYGKPKENIEVTGLNLTAIQVFLMESRNGANGHDSDAIESEAIEIERIESKNGNDDDGENGNGSQ